MARAFANGGSSLTGIEAVSNAVSALHPPEGRNARQILARQGSIVAFLIAGISWLAHLTHATPYTRGFPTVLAQEARHGLRAHPRRAGHVLRVAGRDRRDLVHRRQHQLHRFPVPGQLRRRGLVPAPLADQAGTPAGVLQRDHPARRAVAGADAGGGRDRRRPHPVLRHRRVHRFRHGRVRHGPVPPPDAGGGLAAAPGHQHRGRDLHRARRRPVRGGQVHRGRVARRDPVPGAGVRADPAQQAVPEGGRDPGGPVRQRPGAAPGELLPPRRSC